MEETVGKYKTNNYRAPVTTRNGKDKQVARFIVEAVLGRTLKTTEQVHHVDENPFNNAHSNLVVCPNQPYHHLLHVRTRAYEACGNANYRKCPYCKVYDDPANMSFKSSWKAGSGQCYHAACHKAACKANYEKKMGRV
jgi:hypothetical protein